MDDFIAVFATSPSADEADRIARALVEGGAAPCVNVVPGIVSIYAWKGEVSRDGEWLMIIKSRRDRFPLVREIVEANHSYEVPEVIAVSLAEVSPSIARTSRTFSATRPDPALPSPSPSSPVTTSCKSSSR
jgi:periplasmic divalent cation tolerance protein